MVTLERGIHLGPKIQFHSLSRTLKGGPLRTNGKFENAKWSSRGCAGQENVSSYESMNDYYFYYLIFHLPINLPPFSSTHAM